MRNVPQTVRKKTAIVREHPRRVPLSPKNPTGITIVDRHPRRVRGPSLDAVAIRAITKNYPRTGLTYPTPGRLQYKNAIKYDELIAVWTDYFNKALNAEPPLEPDLIKALIASESGFDADPKTRIAIEISQITKKTLSALQDPAGEAKDFTFKKIRQKDLKGSVDRNSVSDSLAHPETGNCGKPASTQAIGRGSRPGVQRSTQEHHHIQRTRSREFQETLCGTSSKIGIFDSDP